MSNYKKPITLANKLRSFSELNLMNNPDGLDYIDIVLPYFLLYRFPGLFTKSKKSLRREVVYKFKRILSSIKVKLILINKKYNKSLYLKKEFIYLGFSYNQFKDVLGNVHKLKDELNSNINQEKIVIGQYNYYPINSIYNFIYPEFSLDRLHIIKDIKKTKNILFNSGLIESLYNNQPELDPTKLKDEINYFFDVELIRHADEIAIVKNILQKISPLAIITTDDVDQRCRVFTVLAKRNAIKNVMVQQGMVSKYYPEWIYTKADIIAAFGKNSSQIIKSQITRDIDVIITGNPGYDYSSQNLKENNNKSTFLFASQPYYLNAFTSVEIRLKMILDVLNFFMENNDLTLHIKPHPHEDQSFYKKYSDKYKNIIIHDKKDPIQSLIKNCDVLITMFSTVGFEAIYQNKPVINLIYKNSTSKSIYEEYDATAIARNPEELNIYISELANNNGVLNFLEKRKDAIKKFIAENLYLQDHKASFRINEILNELLEKDKL
jgi:hypothetical protein